MARDARDRILAVHRRRMCWEDLEDCYSQATLELLLQARRGTLKCVSRAHLRNILERRFISRVHDRRRALAGRSPREATLGGTLSLGAPGDREVEIADVRADVERRAMLRFELDAIQLAVGALSGDQRLVLASQVSMQISREEFCARLGWSHEKYRKVAQRARGRLRGVVAEIGSQQASGRGRVAEVARGSRPTSTDRVGAVDRDRL